MVLVLIIGNILQNPETDNIIKLRGLPFEAGPAEIIKFFEGRKGRFSLDNFPTPRWLVVFK